MINSFLASETLARTQAGSSGVERGKTSGESRIQSVFFPSAVFLEAPRFGPDPRSELKAVVSTADHGSVLLALCVAARAQAARSSLRDQSAPPPGPYSHILLLGHGYISSQAWLYYVCLRCSPASSRLGRRREDQSQDKEEKGRERLANHNHFHPLFTAASFLFLFFLEWGEFKERG